MKIAIVTTTINVPVFLQSYIKNFKRFSIKPDKLCFIVIGDLKSPHEKVRKYISSLDSNYVIEYWDAISQQRWIAEVYGDKVEDVNFAVPYNSIRRRNIGYLRALELGVDIIISVDDDNFAGESDWLRQHISILKNSGPIPTVESNNRLVNPCQILKFNYPHRIYSRGFPMSKMYSDSFTVDVEGGRKTVLNMGLWTKSPDVDAYTNIVNPNLESLGVKEDYAQTYSLAVDNYMPVNTQNTAFVRELVPAFYDVLMDTSIHGVNLSRYDDIWGGLFALKLIHTIDHRATFGAPLGVHIRNKHDYVSDFKSELWGMILNDRIFDIVMEMNLHAKSYINGYIELTYGLEKSVRKHFKDVEVLKYFSRLIRAMDIWVEMVSKFL